MSFDINNPLHVSISAVVVALVLYRAGTSRSVSVADLPGPESSSFLAGSLGELLRATADKDFEWQEQFGNVVRFKGPLKSDMLLISDPKALNHIFQGARWGQSAEQRARAFFMFGPSISVARGEDHKRHRRIMNPAFGMSEIKSLVPVFFEAVSTLTNKWKDILLDAKDQSEVFNITKWASRATLDAFGHAGFDYDFGAMEDKDNRLAAAAEMFASPTDGMLAGGTLLSSIMPSRLMIWALERMSHSNPRLARGRIMRETATEVAGKVLAEKSKELESGNGGRFKDLMSLLIKANTAPQNENNRMSDEELMAQLLALFIAGHETTANSLSWTLLELCRNPKIQTKLRQEIHQKEREIAAQGRLERGFTAEDLESLTYLDAVVKESLRFQPVVSRMHKTALTNDVLPLSQPVRTTSGVEINEIPIAKGQKAFFSIGTYQRNKALFGEDADIFRPERWLENSHIINKTTSAGVYANLLTFSGGPRSCIGWRFAVYELQAFLVELVSNFEFSLTPESHKIRRESVGVVVPMVEGEQAKGVQCPLRVQFAKRDE